MAVLGRLEIAALKRMEKSLNPLKNQLSRLDKKLIALWEEKKVVTEQYDRMVAVMNTYAGDVPFEQVLRPETFVSEEIQGDVDDTEQVEMEEIPVVDAFPSWGEAVDNVVSEMELEEVAIH